MTADFYRGQLLEDCVPFWFPPAIDREHGGFLHCFDRDGTLADDDKSVWAQGRMSWMLLALYLDLEPRGEWLEWAEHGLRFLEEKCVDRSDGRMYFHVTRRGGAVRKRRYAYSEAFASIAHAAHAAATGSGEAAERAGNWFERYLDLNFTEGKMAAKFEPTRRLTGMGPRMIALATAQELELRLGREVGLTYWIDRNLEEIESLFVKPELQAVLEQVEADGSVSDHFDGRTLNPGHAIEGAWFVMEEGRRRDDSRLVKLGCTMLDWMWERGWDREHGGLLYFASLDGKPVQEYWHEMKFWWPHDEALIATAMAWKLTGEGRYLDWHRQCHDWAFSRFADPENGEWFGYLRRDGTPSSSLKGNMWKSFFHHPRALLRCAKILTERDTE